MVVHAWRLVAHAHGVLGAAGLASWQHAQLRSARRSPNPSRQRPALHPAPHPQDETRLEVCGFMTTGPPPEGGKEKENFANNVMQHGIDAHRRAGWGAGRAARQRALAGG